MTKSQIIEGGQKFWTDNGAKREGPKTVICKDGSGRQVLLVAVRIGPCGE